MSDHHPFGPSVLHRRKACPGSFHMEVDLPDTTSPAAAEGTFMHEAVWDDEKRRDCDAEQLQCLEVCDEALDAFPAARWEEENRLKLTDDDPFMASTLIFGTVDAVGLQEAENRAVCLEFKFGRGEVPTAAMNLQVAAYAAMVMENYDVDEVECYVVQPRVTSDWRASRHVFTDLEGIRRSIACIILKATEDHGTYLEAGEHCRYCRALTVCPELRRQGTDLVEQRKAGLDLINPSNAHEAYDQATLVKRAADEILARVKQITNDAGGQIPGLELVEVQGARQVSDPQQAYTATAEVISHEIFMGLVTVPVGKLESAYAAFGRKNGRFETIKAAKEAFGQAVEMERKAATRKLVRKEARDES